MHSLPIKDVLTLGRFTFASFFEKLILIAFILAAGQIDAFFVKIKFAKTLPRAIGSPTDFTDSLLRPVGQPTILHSLFGSE